jgi:serine/threonine-protein kinase RsbW
MIVSAKPCLQGPRGYCQELPASKNSAEAARRLVETALSVWRLECLADDGTLVVSELVANAVTHTDSRRIQIVVRRLGERSVRIGVIDTARVIPARATPHDHLSASGRGLLLVDALAQRWGADLYHFGKHVWAELISEPAQ